VLVGSRAPPSEREKAGESLSGEHRCLCARPDGRLTTDRQHVLKNSAVIYTRVSTQQQVEN